MKKKNVLVVTGSRAEYGLLYPLMREIIKSRKLALRVLVTGMHTQKRYGNTVDLIVRDHIPIDAVVPIPENATMLEALSREIRGIERYVKRRRPDLMVVLGDRDEPFAAAIVAGHEKIALAHLHGGDASGSLVDEPIRHSISRFAHIHFPATAQSARRLLRLGEEKKCIHVVGSPAYDGIAVGELTSRKELANAWGLDPSLPWLVVLQHPTPLDPTPLKKQITETLEALSDIRAEKIIIYPNSDTGSALFISHLKSFARTQGALLARSLPREVFLSLLKHAQAMVGNSSAALIETGRFKLPVIDIGGRQTGRERGGNVIHVPYDSRAISRALKRALAPTFRTSLRARADPYKKGGASKRIVRILEKMRLDESLFVKRIPR